MFTYPIYSGSKFIKERLYSVAEDIEKPTGRSGSLIKTASPYVIRSVGNVIEFGGMIPAGTERLIRNPKLIVPSIGAGIGMQVGGIAEQIQKNPIQLVSDIAVFGAASYGISKGFGRSIEVVKEQAFKPTEIKFSFDKVSSIQGKTTIKPVMREFVEKMPQQQISTPITEIKPISATKTQQFLPSLEVKEAIKGFSPDTFIRETPKTSFKPRVTIFKQTDFKSPFSSAPVMPGARLLGQSSELGNVPKMQYERMAEQFLPPSRKASFGSMQTKTFILGKSIPKKIKGTAFKELETTWQKRETSFSQEAKTSGFTRTKQGQIVIQKQVQREIQKPKIATMQVTKEIQSPKEVTISKKSQLLYISPITRLIEGQKIVTKSLVYTSPAQRMMTGNRLREAELNKLSVKTFPIQTYKTMPFTAQVPKQTTKQASKQLEKEMQALRTIQSPRLLSPQIELTRFKFESKKITAPKFTRKRKSKFGKFPELARIASSRRVFKGVSRKFKL